MWSTMAARVVVFPDPVGPVTRTRPRISSASRVTDSGSPNSADRGGTGPHPTHGQGDRRPLVVGVDPEPSGAREAVGEVDLVLLSESLEDRRLHDRLG